MPAAREANDPELDTPSAGADRSDFALHVWQEIHNMNALFREFTDKYARLDERLGSIDKRFDSVSTRLDKTELKLSEVDKKLFWLKGAAWLAGIVVTGVGAILAILVWPHIHLLWQN